MILTLSTSQPQVSEAQAPSQGTSSSKSSRRSHPSSLGPRFSPCKGSHPNPRVPDRGTWKHQYTRTVFNFDTKFLLHQDLYIYKTIYDWNDFSYSSSLCFGLQEDLLSITFMHWRASRRPGKLKAESWVLLHCWEGIICLIFFWGCFRREARATFLIHMIHMLLIPASIFDARYEASSLIP